MYIKQIYTGCLSQASYYIESGNECVIIDPIRDIDIYVDLLNKRDKKLLYVLETHFHADFISGHLELSKKYSCPIVYGPNVSTQYNSLSLNDNDLLNIGNIYLQVIHTPGHTLESVCYLLLDENKKQHSLYTGDTLFIGDVGRPDLAINNNLTSKDLSDMLYNSLYNKIMTLNDDIIIYPAHGSGTQCGKNLSSETFSTLKNQKMSNYALNFKNIEEFNNSMLQDLPTAPSYFKESALINKNGYKSQSKILSDSLKAIDKKTFLKYHKENYFILDTRNQKSFADYHLVGSVNIGLNGKYAVSAANLMDIKTKILIISDTGYEKESIIRLNRVGFENILGFLSGGFDSIKNDLLLIDSIQQKRAKELHLLDNYEVIDVRNKSEFQAQHLAGSINCPLYDILNNKDIFNTNKKYAIHCLTGYRSTIASSLLKKNNIKNIVNISDGFNGMSKNSNLIFK